MKELMELVDQYCDPETPLQSQLVVWEYLVNSVKLTSDAAKRVTKGVNKVYKELLPTEEEFERKEFFFKNLCNLLKLNFQNAELHMFGSSANRLCVRGSSDIDLCMVIDMEEHFAGGKKKRKNNSKLVTASREGSRGKIADKVHGTNAGVMAATDITNDEQEVQFDEAYIDTEKDESSEQRVDSTDTTKPESSDSDKSSKSRNDKSENPKMALERALKRKVVNKLSHFLERRRMRDVKPLFNARIPIVKFTDPNTYVLAVVCCVCVWHL